MLDWKPIETAPKDGTEILLWGAESYTKGKYKCGPIAGNWDEEEKDWDGYLGAGNGEYTHWCESNHPKSGPKSLVL